jgi:iron complex transport system ATP-binding protein
MNSNGEYLFEYRQFKHLKNNITKTQFMDNIITIEDANVFLDGCHILKNFDWEVKASEDWFILGANGAGKTTLIKMLMGYVWPKFGAKVEVLGGRYGQCNLVEMRKRIAWVSPFMQKWGDDDAKAVDVVLSGFDATFTLIREPETEEIEQAHEIMEKLGCAKLAQHRYATLSSGEQVKMFIARALVTKPDLMILDEACVHLDFKSREYLLNVVDELAAEPDAPPIIFITQRIEDISRTFTNGIVIANGEMIANGERENILTEDILSQTFDMKIKLHKAADGRFWPLPER